MSFVVFLLFLGLFDSENHSECGCIGQIGERAEVTGFNLGPEFPTAAEWADLSHGGYNGVALGDRIVEVLNHTWCLLIAARRY